MPGKGFKDARGVIFDLDGTLIDSFPAIMEGFNATLPLYGLRSFTLDETKAVVGKPLPDTFSDLLGEEHAAQATAAFRKRYREVYLDMTTPMPFATETLMRLHNAGVVLGVATNKHGEFSRAIVSHLGWDSCIISVVGEGDTKRNKPEPDMILRNAERMSLEIGEVLFVGDSPVDIETGRKAGINTVAVATGYHTAEMLREAGAETVIDDLSHLERFLSCL